MSCVGHCERRINSSIAERKGMPGTHGHRTVRVSIISVIIILCSLQIEELLCGSYILRHLEAMNFVGLVQ